MKHNITVEIKDRTLFVAGQPVRKADDIGLIAELVKRSLEQRLNESQLRLANAERACKNAEDDLNQLQYDLASL